MSPVRLDDRYKSYRLVPGEQPRDDALVALIRRAYPVGSIYHLLGLIIEQAEDIYTILVDDRLVIRLEAPRGNDMSLMTDCEAWSFKEYRDRIGQGKDRMRLDRAASEARELIDLKKADLKLAGALGSGR